MSADVIERKLRHAWRRERALGHVRGACRLVICLVALLAAAYLVDRNLLARNELPGRSAVLLLPGIVAILGGVVWLGWLRQLKRFDPVAVALSVEARHPELSSILVSYVQLGRSPQSDPRFSRELLAAMREQAVEQCGPIDFGKMIDFSRARKLAIAAGGAAVALLTWSIGGGGDLGVLLKRMIGSSARYPPRTEVAEVTGDLSVPYGEGATITAKAGGRIPTSRTVFLRPAGSHAEWEALPMKSGLGERTFMRTLEALSTDIEYYIELGDARSGTHRIDVLEMP